LPPLGDQSNLTKHNIALRQENEILKADLKEKDLKCGALQRNFRSVSELLKKTEDEKRNLSAVNSNLQN
jgi:hypothetical protein